MRFWVWLVVTCVTWRAAAGARLLAVFPYQGHSHQAVFSGIITSLINAGHQVVNVTPIPITKHPNLTQIVIATPDYGWTDMIDIEDMLTRGPIKERQQLEELAFGYMTCLYENSQFQNLIADREEYFDAILYEPFFCQEELSFLGHRFNAPLISIMTSYQSAHEDNFAGTSRMPSVHPDNGVFAPDGMTMWQRAYNTILWIEFLLEHKLYHLPRRTAWLQRYIKYNGMENMGSLEEQLEGISLHIVNSHPAVAPCKPTLPKVLLAPGIHINPEPVLPQDIKELMDGAKNGVVLVSMGSYIPVSKLPRQKRDTFIEALASLDQLVLWKSDIDLPNLPANIKLFKWLPQQAILKHTACKLLVSHGGMLSKQEALYFGVPSLVIPLYGDQPLNAAHTQAAGLGRALLYTDIYSDSPLLRDTLQLLINNSRISETVKATSEWFKMDVMKSKERIVHSTETVILWKKSLSGLTHFRQLNWFQYFQLDWILTIISAAVITSLIIAKIVFMIQSSQSKVSDKKKN